MNRRELLRRAGGLAAAGALAGCLGGTGGGSTSDRETTGERATDEMTTDDTTDETATGDSEPEDSGSGDSFRGIQSDAERPFRTIPVGSRTGVPFPDNNRVHTVRVWNAADEARDIVLRLVRDGEAVLDRRVEFAADAYLELTLNEPAKYRLSVGFAGTDPTATPGVEPTAVEIDRGWFDCNASRTDVGVMPDGRVESNTMSTLLGCPGPVVADTAFTVGDGECGTRHRASVAFDGERVRVDGAVRAPTPRANLLLADATYDRKTDALTVRVRASEDDSGGVGTQCVGEVPYEATVEFDHALPGRVVVVHESSGERVTATEVSRR